VMQDALQAAGFVGIEQEGGAIFARLTAATPEFTVVAEGDLWRFSMLWPLRATPQQCADWAALHPEAPLDVDLGETRMQFLGTPKDAPHWADLVKDMIVACTEWRRVTRRQDEGM
jgi:hypothetical protein